MQLKQKRRCRVRINACQTDKKAKGWEVGVCSSVNKAFIHSHRYLTVIIHEVSRGKRFIFILEWNYRVNFGCKKELI